MNKKQIIFSTNQCGILSPEIETGRWKNKPVGTRICKVCESGKVEDEFHFIFNCTLYSNIFTTYNVEVILYII